MRQFREIFLAAVLAIVLVAFGPVEFAAAKPAWMRTPVVPAIGPKDSKKLSSRVAAGVKIGLRRGVFAKVGDSNTEFAPDLYGFACRRPTALTARLRKTVARYNRVRLANPRAISGCKPNTSFSRRSSAAQAGVISPWPLIGVRDLPDEGYLKKPPGCALDSTPLDCELDALRPRYGLVMLGSNDLGMDLALGIRPGSQIINRLGPVLRHLLDRKVVPVLSTIPPVKPLNPEYHAAVNLGVARTNAGIWRLSRTYRLPMINLWRALRWPGVINQGLADDGLHLSVLGANGEMIGVEPGPTTLLDSVNFSRRALRYGANRRNLIWLKTLARLDRITG